MKKLLFVFSLYCTSANMQAQMVAMDFNRNDCNGNPQHLFADLDAGKAVIIEYFMTSCAPCPAAGQKLEAMKANLLQQYPGKIKSYAIAFNNTYSCSTVNNWVSSNGFSSVPMDSGATQVAYYGGMGMPTIVIAGGSSHQLLGNPYIGFTTSDTTQMANNIRAFLNSQVGIAENKTNVPKVTTYPNPASNQLSINFSTTGSSTTMLIDIIDVTGKKLMHQSFENVKAGFTERTIDVSALAQGTYILQTTIAGNVNRQRIVISR